jgi:hypothetical protein
MTESQDFRNPAERLADFVDSKLFDLYHDVGLIESSEGASYSHDEVLKFMRAAYWRGVIHQAHDNGEIAQAAAEHAADLRIKDRPPGAADLGRTTPSDGPD